MMVIEKNQIGTTSFNPEEKVIYESYIGRTNIKLIEDHFDKIIRFSHNNDIAGSVVDLRKLYGSFIKLLEIIETTYYPKMKKSGLRFQAVIISNDLIFENLYGKVSKLAAKFGIEAKLFRDYEKAIIWMDDNLKEINK
jgi:hypothetical protein